MNYYRLQMGGAFVLLLHAAVQQCTLACASIDPLLACETALCLLRIYMAILSLLPGGLACISLTQLAPKWLCLPISNAFTDMYSVQF